VGDERVSREGEMEKEEKEWVGQVWWPRGRGRVACRKDEKVK